MQTQRMSTAEHRQQALDFLDAADQEFATGDFLQGSEKMWGAAAHALIAVGMQRSLPYETHAAMRNIARRLAGESQEPWMFTGGFSIAEFFHINFYHGFQRSPLDDDGLELWRMQVRAFVERVVEITA